MTYKERWIQEHSNRCFNPYIIPCPHAQGYEVTDKSENCCIHRDLDCQVCWDREIPEKDTFNSVSEFNEQPLTSEEKETLANMQKDPRGEFLEKTMRIKDSGDRTRFESGAVRDMHEGKGRMDLLPWAAIMEVSKHCENGAKKYGEHNVDKGIPTNSLCDSAARHLAKYLEGWTDEPHLVAAAWNLLWAIQMELKKPEVVNTPWNLRDGITDMKPE